MSKKIALGATGAIILLIALVNSAGYFANIFADPHNWWIWGITAGVVFALAAIVETYKDEDNKGGD